MRIKENKKLLYVFLFIAILIGILFIQEFLRKKSLGEFKITESVVTYVSSDGYRSGYQILVKYQINGKNYESDGVGGVRYNNCKDKINVGDTVLIKYSIRNPKIVSIIECEDR